MSQRTKSGRTEVALFVVGGDDIVVPPTRNFVQVVRVVRASDIQVNRTLSLGAVFIRQDTKL